MNSSNLFYLFISVQKNLYMPMSFYTWRTLPLNRLLCSRRGEWEPSAQSKHKIKTLEPFLSELKSYNGGLECPLVTLEPQVGDPCTTGFRSLQLKQTQIQQSMFWKDEASFHMESNDTPFASIIKTEEQATPTEVISPLEERFHSIKLTCQRSDIIML